MSSDRVETDAGDTPALDGCRRAVTSWSSPQPASSAEESAQFQGIELHQLLRTIVVRRGDDDYLFVLVPGGRRFDWPKLRASPRRVSGCRSPTRTRRSAVTGYERGTITPFGSSRAWPVIADASIGELDMVAIGGGQRGVNVHLRAGRPRRRHQGRGRGRDHARVRRSNSSDSWQNLA